MAASALRPLALYRSILVAHRRFLPPTVRSPLVFAPPPLRQGFAVRLRLDVAAAVSVAQHRPLGDAYVKEEFRNHVSATPAQTKVFLEEWSGYLQMLRQQSDAGEFGAQLTSRELEEMNDEQRQQVRAPLGRLPLDASPPPADFRCVQLMELRSAAYDPKS